MDAIVAGLQENPAKDKLRRGPVPSCERPAGRILGPSWDDHDTFSVVEAGKILGLKRAASYAAAARGDLPTIEIGHRKIVPRVALERLLAGA